MRILLFGGIVYSVLSARQAEAQGTPPTPGPFPGGRLGLSAGLTYDRRDGGGYGALLSGMYYLTPENRPLSFRAQAYASWTPSQTVTSFNPVYGAFSRTGSSFQAGGGVAAILHARPRSRISPYLIVGAGLAQRWQAGSGRSFDLAGQAIGAPVPFRHAYMQGEFSVGAGLRVRMGGQVIRLEIVNQNNRAAVTLGMSIPF